MTVLLAVEAVTKAFGGVTANDGIDLVVAEGAIVALVGPNGSGKTTLFNCVVGAHPIDKGKIFFRSEEISSLRPGAIARRGLVRTFQHTRTYTQLTCMENLLVSAPLKTRYLRRLLERPSARQRAQAMELLDFVGLQGESDFRAGDLSYGQQKLLELSMVLMSEPVLLLLDEPLSGINPTLVQDLMRRLRQINAETGVALLVIEHNIPAVMDLCDSAYCLANGKVLASGTPEQVQNDPAVLDAYLGGTDSFSSVAARDGASAEGNVPGDETPEEMAPIAQRPGRKPGFPFLARKRPPRKTGGESPKTRPLVPDRQKPGIPPQAGKEAELSRGLEIEGLVAGYGGREILHDIDLTVGPAQAVCLIGPNGSGKSTVLQSIYGFAEVMRGTVRLNGQEIVSLAPQAKLRDAGIAYIMQHSSIFPDMTVEENLLMGGYLLKTKAEAQEAAEQVLAKYDALARARGERARVLSGGERRLLEISRALIMNPKVLLVDEPSIGLAPRAVEMVFEILAELRDHEEKTLVLVEQNAKKGLAFANTACVLTAGQVVLAGPADTVAQDPTIGKLFLGE